MVEYVGGSDWRRGGMLLLEDKYTTSIWRVRRGQKTRKWLIFSGLHKLVKLTGRAVSSY